MAPLVAGVLAAAVLAVPAAGAACEGFAAPERVHIHGYDGVAMEPFVTRDGAWLLFNDANEPGADTNLHVAQRFGSSFLYLGPLPGANSPELDGVPSVDDNGRIVFVSARSYGESFSTLYGGRFREGRVEGVALLPGVSRETPGYVNFDAEISPDGSTLVFVDGTIVPGSPLPLTADLVMAVRAGRSFFRHAGSEEIFAAVNTQALEYAPALSRDGRELLFTRWTPVPGSQPAIYRTTRPAAGEPFGEPLLVSAFDGFVEAPAFAPDEDAIYLHRRGEDGVARIYRAERCA